MKKKALITGVTGQDGAYLAKLLLEKNYKVYGTVRRSTSEKFNKLRSLNIHNDIIFCDFDLLELSNIQEVIKKTKPNESLSEFGWFFFRFLHHPPNLKSQESKIRISSKNKKDYT